jgi:uncharacterized protein with FMN-binding domain
MRTLPPWGRRSLLAVHLSLAAVWLGGACAVALALASLPGADPEAQRALSRLVVRVQDLLLVNASYGFAVTGMLFSLFTPWGATRFVWVMLKWLGIGVLLVLLLGVASPEAAALDAVLLALGATAVSTAVYADHVRVLALATAAQVVLLLGLLVLSVFKPGHPRPDWKPWPRTAAWAVFMAGTAAVVGNAVQQQVVLQQARDVDVPPATAVDRADGDHEGIYVQGGWEYRVVVRLRSGRIEQVRWLTPRSGAYAGAAAAVVQAQEGRTELRADAVAGATTTSKALLMAVADALRRAPAAKEMP